MDPAYLFEPELRNLRRKRSKLANFHEGWLFREGAEALADRLSFIKRDFDKIVLHGADFHALSDAVSKSHPFFEIDAEVEIWPTEASGVDLILSNLQLHWVNDLPGLLTQIRRALVPDGFFSAALIGGTSLFELRSSLIETEERCGLAHAPRMSPMIDLPTAAGLMQRAGFALPVVDHELVRTTFSSPLKLLKDLRAMGQTNAVKAQPRQILPRAFWPIFDEVYKARFPDGSGGVTATFDLVFLSGWAPADTQQKPLTPGSAAMELRDGLNSSGS